MCVMFLHYKFQMRKSRLPGINYTVQHSSFKFCIAEQSGQSNIPVLRLLLLNMT